MSFLLEWWGKKQDCKGQLVDGPKEKWRPDLEVVEATKRFLEQTGRLDYCRQAVGASSDWTTLFLSKGDWISIGLVRSLSRDGSYGHRE